MYIQWDPEILYLGDKNQINDMPKSLTKVFGWRGKKFSLQQVGSLLKSTKDNYNIVDQLCSHIK